MVTKAPVREMTAVTVKQVGALSPEELADRIVPSDPRISPDGTAVVFVAEPTGRRKEHRTRTLWMANGREQARQLTGGLSDDSDPRWSPDGSHILFRSDRQKPGDLEQQRLYLLPVNGGEAQPLGELGGELSCPAWSPDGKFVAVIRKDPEPEAVKARKKERDDAIVVEEDPRYSRLWIIDVATGRARCLTTGEREVRAYDWLPDSAALVAVTTDGVDFDAVMGPSNLWLVPVAGAMSRHLARFVATPSTVIVAQTEDGAVVAAKADGHREFPAESIWTVPIGGGEPHNLIPDMAHTIEEIAPLPGRPGHVAARFIEGTHGRLYAVDVVSGERSPLTPPAMAEKGSVLGGVSFSAAGDRVAGIWSDATTPEEVYLCDVSGDAVPATTFGSALAGRLLPAEHVTWTSDDGVEVEGILIYPPGYEPGWRYPLVVEIHGGPSWQWEDRAMLDWHDWAQMLASRGYAVLLPNPRGSAGYGHEFQRLLQDDVGGGESRDLIAGAKAMVEQGIADADRIGIAGWSWGGYLTAWTITQTQLFKAAVMGAGLANMISDHGQGDIPSANLFYYPGLPYQHMDAYWSSSPIRYVAAVKTPTLILHGDEDARVHPAQGMEYFRALKSLGVPVRFVRYPREKHSIGERAHQIDLMNRIIDWFDRYLMRPRS